MKHPIIQQLRMERRTREWSQDAVAEQLGKGGHEVSRYESGKHSPLLHTVAQWADVLGYELVLVKKP